MHLEARLLFLNPQCQEVQGTPRVGALFARLRTVHLHP